MIRGRFRPQGTLEQEVEIFSFGDRFKLNFGLGSCLLGRVDEEEVDLADLCGLWLLCGLMC